MKEISESSKVMVLFGVLTIFINQLKDLNLKHGAKKWVNILNKQAVQMWNELIFQTRRQGDYAEFAYDEFESFIYKVNEQAFEVPIDKMQDYIKFLENWNKPKKVRTNKTKESWEKKQSKKELVQSS